MRATSEIVARTAGSCGIEGAMIVEQVWTGNSLRNFNYLVACPETGEALAIDPLDFHRCLALARARGWSVRQILNTHEHGDHTGGNKGMIEATGAEVIAHENARGRIPGMTSGVGEGDAIRVGRTVELECLDTPGHTMSHVCLLAHADGPALFSGDTLFNAGAGNCHNGGNPVALYETFVNKLSRLPDDTKLYPGHDYLSNNLAFTLDREPDNGKAAGMLAKYRDQDPENAYVTTLGEERDINVFFRLRSPSVIARLREADPRIDENPDPQTVFLKLRELRNTW